MALQLTCALLAALAAGPASAAQRVDDSARERVEEIVRAALVEQEHELDLDELKDRLVELGPGASGPLFELLVAGVLSTDAGPETLARVGEDLILGALAGLPHASLLAVLGRLGVPLESAELRAVHLALGATGDAGDLGLLIRLSAPESEQAGLGFAARAGFEDSLSSILARHRDEAWLVAKHYDAAPPGLRAPLLRAVERARMSAQVSVFAGLLDVHPELDVLLLGQLARVGHPWTGDAQAVGRVRDSLLSNDGREVLAAVIALAQFEDGESVDTLIGLLETADPQLSEQIVVTLVRTTGRNFRGDVERWRAWRGEAARWWRVQAPELFGDLWSQDGSRVAAAVNDLAQHPLYRREVEAELLASLDPGRPELCALMCRVLGRLGSPRAQERLKDLSLDRDEWVSNAAQAALEEISRRTGREFTEPEAAESR